MAPFAVDVDAADLHRYEHWDSRFIVNRSPPLLSLVFIEQTCKLFGGANVKADLKRAPLHDDAAASKVRHGHTTSAAICSEVPRGTLLSGNTPNLKRATSAMDAYTQIEHGPIPNVLNTATVRSENPHS